MKGAERTKPKVASLDAIDVTTNESNIPSTYFAGIAKLNGFAIMTPIISRVKTTPTGGKGK